MVFHETQALSDFRPGYLPEFFPACARRLGLTGNESLLDLGCGWGDVTIGFAPYVASLTALDPERPSLDALAARARQCDRAVRTVESRVEDADLDLGRFDVITIGRSIWYMEPAPTLLRLNRWLKPGGRVIVCSPDESNAHAWGKMVLLLIGRWQRGPKPPDVDWTPYPFFRGTSFRYVDQVEVFGEQQVDLDHAVKRFFAYPQTSPEILGADAARAGRDARLFLARFFKNGPLTEALRTFGVIYEPEAATSTAAP